MSNTVLIILAIVGTVGADVGAVIAIRREVRRWCLDTFTAGHRAGRESSEPFAEAYKLGYDVGHERGHRDGYDEAVNDAVENPDAFADRLEEIRPQAGKRGRRGWIQFEGGNPIELPDEEGPHDPRD